MPETTGPAVGQRIRLLREERGLSLRALSERSGLSANAISLIERGENSPTVSSLHLLATALRVSITEFFAQERSEAVVFVEPDKRLRTQAEGILMESLGIGLKNQQIEPFLLVVEPGATNMHQPITHFGEEFIYCLAGEIEYCVGSHIHRLTAGCSLLFKADLPHCFRNLTDAPVQLLMVFHASEGGHLARRLHMDATAVTVEPPSTAT